MDTVSLDERSIDHVLYTPRNRYTAVVTAIDDDRLTCLYMHDGSEDILQQGTFYSVAGCAS